MRIRAGARAASVHEWVPSGATAVRVCAVITVVAAALRIYALNYGLPAIYNPDEIPILNRALAFGKGDLNPHNFLYPTLYFYALFVWEALFYFASRALGVYHSLAEFQNSFFVDPSRLILAGRALTAVFGIATIAAVYRFGSNLFNRTVGLGAALFLAVSPFAVRDAHYVKLDVPTTLFVTLTYAVLSRLVVDPQAAATRRTWLLAGYCAGLAMACHYYALFIVVPFAVVAAGDVRRSGRWTVSAVLLAIAAAGTVAGFVTGSPFFAVELPTAMRDIAGVREVDIDRALAGSTTMFPSFGPYLQMLLTDAVGWPVFAASVAGVVSTDWRRGLLLLSFPVVFLAFVSHTVPESRYLNVLLPVIAVAAAAGLLWLLTRLRGTSPLAVGSAFVLAAVPGLLGSIMSDRFYLQPDTRTLAGEYIESHVTPGATILIQPYSVPLHRSRDSVIEALRAHLGSEDRASIKFQLQLAATPYPAPAYRVIFLGDGGADPDKIYVSPRAFAGGDFGPLERLGVDYVVLKRYNSANPALDPLESALRQRARLVATMSPYRDEARPEERAASAPFLHNTAARIEPALRRPGPIVDIWQIK
jgi:hypothetical protein